MATVKEKKKISPARAVLFSVCACLLFFIVCEVLLRLFGYAGYQIDFGVYRDVPGDITPRQRLVHKVPSVGVEYEITINAQGFRAPGRIRPESPCRILCLGDSSTMGYGVPDRETYPARLASFLDAQFSGIFDVINAGSIGYTIDDELSYLADKSDMVKPDIVILEVFYNDVIEKIFRTETQRAFRGKSFTYTPLKSLMLKSAVYHVLRNAYVLALAKAGRYFPENPTDKMDMAMHPERFPAEWAAYEAEFEKLVQYLRKRNVPLLALISPHQYQVYSWGYPYGSYYDARGYQDRVIEIAGRSRTPYVDLLPLLRDEATLEQAVFLTYGLYDEHESDIGQLFKARAVYDALLHMLKQEGFYDLYSQFDEATVSASNANGKASRGRQWRSQDDAPSLILRPDVAIQFSGLDIRHNSWLRFSAGIATWSRTAASTTLNLRVLARDETSSSPLERSGNPDPSGEITLYAVRLDPRGKSKPPRTVKNLSPVSGKNVTLTFELTGGDRESSSLKEGAQAEVFISNPVVFVSRKGARQD